MLHDDVVVFVDVGELPPPPLLVSPEGNTVAVAVAYVPGADVPEHTPGTLEAPVSPQEAGSTLLRAITAVKNEASSQNNQLAYAFSVGV